MLKGYKTILVAAIEFVLFALGWNRLTEFIDAQYIAMIAAALMFVLRFITNTPIFKSAANAALVIVGGLFLFATQPVQAQQSAGAVKKYTVSMSVQPRFGLGVMVDTGEEDVAFNSKAVNAELDWYGISLPASMSTGLRIRVGQVGYSLWSISEIWLVKGRLYQQVGAQFATMDRAAQALVTDFDGVLTTGIVIGKVGPFLLAQETTFLKDTEPIYVGLKMRF